MKDNFTPLPGDKHNKSSKAMKPTNIKCYGRVDNEVSLSTYRGSTHQRLLIWWWETYAATGIMKHCVIIFICEA